MATTLIAKIILKLQATLENTTPELSSAKDQINREIIQSLTNGTGANQGNMLWHDQRTLGASATEDLDLAGVLADAFGVTQAFARVNTVVVVAAAGNTNNVNFSRTVTNGAPIFLNSGDGIPIPPGGWAAICFGASAVAAAITAATADKITIANAAGGSSVTYDIFVFGSDT